MSEVVAHPDVPVIDLKSNIVIEAVAAEARAAANLAADRLEALGYDRTVTIPLSLLLMFGVALRISMWERLGLGGVLPSDLPSGEKLDHEITAALFQGGRPPNVNDAVSFTTKYLRAWLEHFAWTGPEDLGAEMIAAGPLTADQLSALADFLWSHRNLGRSESNAEQAA